MSSARLGHEAPLTVWTVGHSTRTTAEFLTVLTAHRIEAVADVRRHAGSRRLPQFGQEALRATLESHGLAYVPIPALGGRRRPVEGSPNTGWRHPSFRGYADHMATEEFAEGLFALLMLASALRTAVMCAEALWWRCHRRLIADVLVSLDVQVLHIRSTAPGEGHRLAVPAQIGAHGLSYPAGADSERAKGGARGKA